ncbi:TonB-dependent receptor [Massilia sp. ST3]|uniref:TonB-dependent receptor n=1 Tax=Massilia sp. ST3 TaxID=2824903 RepID=UPI001B846071|nr:TonB-dependent receptor [Massilia sp. ST3]MBQ5947924.1 TonB-dependent receptor [Massilia sp. ST3]
MHHAPRFARTATATAVSLLCAFAALPIHAQEAAATANPAINESGIDKVIVTAQKREQAAIDVPASVTSVNTDQLTKDGKIRLEDYVAQVPGMSLSSFRQGFTQVTLRGITTGVNQSASTTAFYIDEAPIGSVNAYAAGSAVTPDIDPADLQRVEILKGPQGTLYGAGAMGGLVRYVTSAPDFRKLRGSVTLGGNTVKDGGNGKTGRFSLNVPIGERSMALRVSGFSRTDAGYIDRTDGREDVNEAKVEGGRVAFNWIINPEWKLSAFALTQKVKSKGNSLVDVDPVSLRPLYGELTQKRFADELSSASLDVANITLNGQLGAFELVSSTTVQDVDASQGLDGSFGYGVALGAAFGLPDLGIQYAQGTSTRRVSQELRLRSQALDDKLEYEGGLYYTKEDNTNRIPGFRPFSTTTGQDYPLPSIVKASIDTSYKEYSLFANATYALSPAFDLMAGIRHGKDEQVYSQDYRGLLVGPTPVLINSGSKENKTTYLASARYKPSATDALYGRVATGFRPGGPNAVPPTDAAPAPQTFQPDTLTSYEVGYKSVIDGGRVSIEAALFSTNWKDIQIQTSAAGFNFIVNGGAATSRGAELAISYFPLAGLALRASAGYTDAKLSEDAPAAGGLDGDRLPFVPKLSGSLGANYRWPLTKGWSAYAGGTINYTGERRSDFSQRAAKDVDAYTTVNLNGGIENGNWRLAFYAKNLGNSDGVTFLKSQSLSPAGSPFGASVIAPRTIGADLSYRF